MKLVLSLLFFSQFIFAANSGYSARRFRIPDGPSICFKDQSKISVKPSSSNFYVSTFDENNQALFGFDVFFHEARLSDSLNISYTDEDGDFVFSIQWIKDYPLRLYSNIDDKKYFLSFNSSLSEKRNEDCYYLRN